MQYAKAKETAKFLSSKIEESPKTKFYAQYGMSVLVLLLVLFCFSKFASSMPLWVFALILTLLTAVATPTLTYISVVTKLHNRTLLKQTGFLAKITNGKILRTIIMFALSTAAMFGLLLSVVRWGQAEWIIALLGAIACPFVFMLANKLSTHEFKLTFEKTGTLIAGKAILFLMMGIASVAVIASNPAPESSSLLECFRSHGNPFPLEESPSTLLADTGLIASYTDTIAAWLLSHAFSVSQIGYIALKATMTVLSLGGFTTLLCACMMPECVREFVLPLVDAGQEQNGRARRPQASLIALSAILAVAPVVLCLTAEAKASEFENLSGISKGKQLIREQIGIAVYIFDGKTYEKEAVDIALKECADGLAQLATARETLVPLINASFDQRIENIDGYLDWYYSLPADYERLIRFFAGGIEEGLQDKLSSSLSEGIDDSELNGKVQAYMERAIQLQSDLKERLSDCEAKDVPNWLCKPAEFDPKKLQDVLSLSDKISKGSQRVTASFGAGVIGGAITKKIVERAAEKEIIGKMASKLSSFGLKTILSAGGGAAGSAVTPGPGTIAGIAAGTIIGTGIDIALLKADETQNRQNYHDELVKDIEQQRADILAAFSEEP